MEYNHDDKCTCPGCLTWDDYDNVYIDFAMEYSQQMLTHTLSVELLSDFPKNLPKDILIPIIAKRHEVLSAEMKRRGEAPEDKDPAGDAFFREDASIKLTDKQHRIRCAYEGLYGLARFGKKMPELEFPQFHRFLVSQNVVVICSYAEGFIANTLRKLCEVVPTPIDRWKQNRSNKLSGLNESEIFDQFIFQMGYGSFDKKVSRMEFKFGLNLPISESDRIKISKLFFMRNCIVHNAGLVSKAYKQSGQADASLQIGDEVPLPEDEIEELIDTLVDAVVAIYRSVSLDVLKKPPERLFYGPHRNLTVENFEG